MKLRHTGIVICIVAGTASVCSGSPQDKATEACSMNETSACSTPYVVAPPYSLVFLDSPYRPRTNVFKGQLHAHTTNSDGKQSPFDVVAAYHRAGYDFIAITDHNWNTRVPVVPRIIYIPGVENDFGCKHENRINATTVAPGARVPQDVINQAKREGSFVFINHPDWSSDYSDAPCWNDAQLLAVYGYDAVEAWNASNQPVNRNSEKRIDMLLSNGRQTNLVAVDDCHDVYASYCMTSSVSVFADQRSVTDIMSNLKDGNFYASSGARISYVSAFAEFIVVGMPQESDVEFIGNQGKVLKTERAVSSSTYTVNGDERYVRIRVTHRPDGHMAWTNPIYVSKR